MAVSRDHPYAQFNFLVDIGDGDEHVAAGFAEVSGLDTQVDVIEYRNGNSRLNEPMKLVGLTRVDDVTLRRGAIGALDLWEWFKEVRSGSPNARRTVVIRLQNEERTETVMSWELVRARPIRHATGPFSATESDVAVEELVLSCERLELQ